MPEEKSQSSAPNFNDLEKGVLKFWDDNKIFEKSLQQTEGKEPFVFYDGPPFATGVPHHGSLLSSIIKDAVGRYQTMQGHYVRRRWGWDCHGLPIENIVEQNLKISGKKQIEEIGVERFNKICRENVLKFVDEWGKTVHRIGRWVDFGPPSLSPESSSDDAGGPSPEALAKGDEAASADEAAKKFKRRLRNSYKTMDTSYMESVWWALKQVWEKGLIYEDRKVLLYCSRCETPISNFEVAMDNSYRDITEESVYAKFKIVKGGRFGDNLADDKTYALAWTTTPWTLPGNTALNVGPEIRYVLVEQNGEKYILAKERLSVLEGEYEVKAEFSARSLEGLQYEPLYPGIIQDPEGRAHRIYEANFVTTEDGTGIVHNAAMYGEEDYQLAKEKNLPRLDMLDHKGEYLDMAPENLRGVFFKDADKVILDELKSKGLVYKTEHYLHSYPHCWRCGTPLFYNALPAWFINIQKIKPELLKANEEINWYPDHLKYGRFAKSMEQAPDWNISRNRYWATALPFWKCTNEECKDVACVGSINELMEQSTNIQDVYPVVSPFMGSIGTADLSAEALAKVDKSANYNSVLQSIDLHRPYIDLVKLKCEKCGGEMNRVPEVVDCWVESGSMPFAELHYPFENSGDSSAEDFKNRFPADFVAEYIPQTRAWFYVMHVLNNTLFGKAPFKNVVTTGTVLAEDGSKMSKSKNNYPDPWLIFEKYGVDALRFYLLSSPVMNAEDLNFSEKGVTEINRKVSLLLYNVWSFYRMYEKSEILNSKFEIGEQTHILDKWILAKLAQTSEEVTKHMDGYNTVKACRTITDFINGLSTWYVRRSRDRMKANNEDSRQALSTLGFVLAETSKLLAPVMPFLADYIYRDVTGKESVHLEAWTETADINQEILKDMELVREIVSLGQAARKNAGVAVRQPLLALGFEAKDVNLSAGLEEVVKAELNVKEINSRLLDKDTRPDKVAAAEGTGNVKQVILDLTMTPELKAEGLARELERAVQDLRKKSGLKVGQLVDVYYNTQDEELEQALLTLFDRTKTFVSQISKSLEVEADFETQADISGKGVWIGMNKI